MLPRPLPIGPGQESVWAYPRPATLELAGVALRVVFAGAVVAQSEAGWRTLETSHPPSYYLPRADVNMALLRPNSQTTFCEWKGRAHYFDLVLGERLAPAAAWTYPRPSAPFANLANCIAFYPAVMDACFVGDERVTPQPGGFYGGWITANVIGPFKGVPGSAGW